METRKSSSTSGFSLPVMLSFNELAWIAIFGIGLFSAFLYHRLKESEADSGDGESLRLLVAELRRELAATRAQLDALHEQTRAREAKLQQQLNELQETLNRARADLASSQAANTGLAEEVAHLDRIRQQLEADLKTALAELKAAEARAKSSDKKWVEASTNLKQLSQQNDALKTAADQTIKISREREQAEFFVRQDLIGINAENLKRVIILFDTSSSMWESSAWNDAKRLVRSWLEHLPVEECVLINFDTDVHVFPETGVMRLRQPDRTLLEANRTRLLQRFDQIKGGSLTDTLAALKKAYEYSDVSMILLFTDGAPRTLFKSYAQMKSEIFTLVRNHSQQRLIPINTIGLGNYENLDRDDVNAGHNIKLRFLRELSGLTGGTFMARGTTASPR